MCRVVTRPAGLNMAMFPLDKLNFNIPRSFNMQRKDPMMPGHAGFKNFSIITKSFFGIYIKIFILYFQI